MSVRDEWRWTDEDGVQRLVRTDELREALENRVLPGSTLVWREGMKQWAPASTMPELSAAAKKAELNRAAEEPDEVEPPNRGDRNTPTALLTSDADGPTAPPQVAIPKQARGPMRTLVGVQVPDAEIGAMSSSSGAPIIVPPTKSVAKGASITIPPRFTPPPPAAESPPPAIPAAPRLPQSDAPEDEDEDDERPTRQKDVSGELWSMGEDSDTLVRASELDDSADGPTEKGQAERRETTSSARNAEPDEKPEPAAARKRPPLPSRPPPPLPARARGRTAGTSRPPPPMPRERKEPAKDKPSTPAPPRIASNRTTARWPPTSTRNAPEPLRVPKSKHSRPKPPKPASLRPPSPTADVVAPTADIKVNEAPVETATEGEGLRVNTLIGGLKPKAVTATPLPKAVTATPLPKPVTATPLPKAVTATPLPKAVTATPLPKAVTATPLPKAASSANGASEINKPDAAAKAPHASDARTGTVPRKLPNLSDEDDTKTEVRPDELRAERAAEQQAAAAEQQAAAAETSVAETPAAETSAATTPDSLPLPPHSDPPPPLRETTEEVSVPPPAPVGFNSEEEPSPRPSAFPHLRDPVSVPMSSLVATGGVWVLLLVSAFLVGRCTAVEQRPPTARSTLTQTVRSLRLPQPESSSASSAEPKPCWVTRQAVKWAPRANKSVPFGLRPTDEGMLELGYAVSEGHARGLEINPKSGKATELFSQDEDQANAISRVTPLGSAHGGFVVSSRSREEDSDKPTTLPVAATPPFFLTIADKKISLSDSLDSTGEELWSTSTSEPVSAMRVLNAPGKGFGITFRQDSAIWSAWLGPDRKPVGALTKVVGSGGKVGRPNSAWNTKEFALIFADKAEDAETWEIRLGHAPTGALPTDTIKIAMPEGGPGGDAFAPDIVGLPDGRWLLMWTEGPGPGERAVRAQTLAADFTPIGDPIALSPPSGSFGQAVLGVVGTYTTVVFLSQGDEGFELWGAVLQCG